RGQWSAEWMDPRDLRPHLRAARRTLPRHFDWLAGLRQQQVAALVAVLDCTCALGIARPPQLDRKARFFAAVALTNRADRLLRRERRYVPVRHRPLLVARHRHRL